jgi:hypothetical protein
MHISGMCPQCRYAEQMMILQEFTWTRVRQFLMLSARDGDPLNKVPDELLELTLLQMLSVDDATNNAINLLA